MMLSPKTPDNPLDPAMWAFNLRGELSPSQRAYVERRRLSVLWLLPALGVVIGVAFWYSVFMRSVLPALNNGQDWYEFLPLIFPFIFLLFLLPTIIRMVRMATVGILAMRDLADGTIEQGRGVSRWNGSSYELVVEGRTLDSSGWGNPLPPGDYNFYYTPQSGLLLSAQPLSPLGSGLDSNTDVTVVAVGTQQDGPLDAALAQAHGFTMEDLAANRAGRLTAGQARKLVRDAIGTIAFGLVFLVVGLLVLGLAIVASEPPLGIGLLFGLLFGGAGIAIIFGARTQFADRRKGIVLSSDGLITRERRRTKNNTTYFYVLNELKFRVSPNAYNALIEGLHYRVYYTPRSKTLVSVEALEEESGVRIQDSEGTL